MAYVLICQRNKQVNSNSESQVLKNGEYTFRTNSF